MNPYQLIINNGRYYILGNYDSHSNMAHCRVDRMTEVEVLDESRKPLEHIDGFQNGINLSKYMAEHMYLFGGESSRVLMKVRKEVFNDVVDWFGTGFTVRAEDEECYTISVCCNEDAMFLWAMQYNTNVEILEPQVLREKIRERTQMMLDKYSQNV